MLYKKEVMEDNKKLKEENRLLKILCNQYEEEHKTTFEEWKKTINIINELKKWLNEWKSWIDRPDEFEDGIISCINDTLDKLQELKGSDNDK